MHLPLLNTALRVDWPLLLSATAVGITLCGATLMALQARRTRRRVLNTLERVFEQLDLLRLDAQPLPAAHAPGVPMHAPHASASVRETPAAAAARVIEPPAELADYQAAARLAAHGAPLAEIAERCGVVAGEARVLQALQRAAQQRTVQQRAVTRPVAAQPAPARALRPARGGAL
jgi:hypothetical protein